eukprot:5367743-Amphidinium_carterae.1
MSGMRVHFINFTVFFAMLLMARAHLSRAWTMALPFNTWFVSRAASLLLLQTAADDDTNSQPQQRPQPLDNYSYIDTTLTIAIPQATMATGTTTGQAQRP